MEPVPEEPRPRPLRSQSCVAAIGTGGDKKRNSKKQLRSLTIQPNAGGDVGHDNSRNEKKAKKTAKLDKKKKKRRRTRF